jgi:hypothetical protein
MSKTHKIQHAHDIHEARRAADSFPRDPAFWHQLALGGVRHGNNRRVMEMFKFRRKKSDRARLKQETRREFIEEGLPA